MKVQPYGSYDPAIAAQFIASWEGKRLTAYRCSAGIWTIGYGHTKGVREGDTCSEEQVQQWLIEDIRSHVNQLSHYINVPVTENEFIALTSLAFNVGVTAVSGSALLRKLNAGDTEAAATVFLDFCYAGGKRVKGLVNRRKAEYELFTTD